MNRIYRILAAALLSLSLFSCGKNINPESALQGGDLSLIGRAVNFDASFAENYVSKATYNHDGSFNEGDVMTIYRQYWGEESDDWAEMDFRVYRFNGKYATNSSIMLSREWKVFAGRLGGRDNGELFVQEPNDSLIWDNGKTVRFRAWCRSNLAGQINTDNFYPDYCVSDWVTVSGPSQSIPLALKHVGCRLTFDEFAGNEISNVELCTRLEDYIWDDNADSYEHDIQDPEPDPQGALASVLAVYNRMCMPAGVDLENYFISTMTTDLYEKIRTDRSTFPNGFQNFEEICQRDNIEGIIPFDTMNSVDIAKYAQRPKFNRIDGYTYMITSPYDMSNEVTNGDVLVLPACTRFRVYLYDVNTGQDKIHIFALKDVKKNGSQAFPTGMPLLAGHSFIFRVGYQYDQFTVDVIEEDMTWGNGGSSELTPDPDVPTPSASAYAWWTGALHTAADNARETKHFEPVFHIANETEFEEFIKLVNGTTGCKREPVLRKARRAVDNPEADRLDNAAERRMYWYSAVDGTDTTWITKAEALAQGYLFYRAYHPQIGTTEAYSEDVVLDAPYSFYQSNIGSHFTVNIHNDIDFKDRLINAVGATAGTSFMGYFDGGMHLLSNLNVEGGYLFANIINADIRNVRIESMRPLALLQTGSAESLKSVRILGVSLKSPSTYNPLATSLTGRAYVIGCIYEGDSPAALVGTAENMTMYGCMSIAPNVSAAALLAAGDGLNRFRPQATKEVVWNGYFECNYFLCEPGTLSATARPVPASTASQYKPQQYIRGVRSYTLRAIEDNLLGDDVHFEDLKTDAQKNAYYGLAPYKAMNYAIEVQYNLRDQNYGTHPCNAHFTVDKTGYMHLYPQLVSDRPVSGTDYGGNPVNQNN